MKRITLLFPDMKSLWTFAQTLQSQHIHINSTAHRLTCDCSELDVSKALMHYNAKIIDEIEERKFIF